MLQLAQVFINRVAAQVQSKCFLLRLQAKLLRPGFDPVIAGPHAGRFGDRRDIPKHIDYPSRHIATGLLGCLQSLTQSGHERRPAGEESAERDEVLAMLTP